MRTNATVPYWGRYTPGCMARLEDAPIREDFATRLERQEIITRLTAEVEDADLMTRFTARVRKAIIDAWSALREKELSTGLTAAEKREIWRLDKARYIYRDRWEYFTSKLDYSPVLRQADKWSYPITQ